MKESARLCVSSEEEKMLMSDVSPGTVVCMALTEDEEILLLFQHQLRFSVERWHVKVPEAPTGK